LFFFSACFLVYRTFHRSLLITVITRRIFFFFFFFLNVDYFPEKYKQQLLTLKTRLERRNFSLTQAQVTCSFSHSTAFVILYCSILYICA
jgi:hypothetical protein